MGFLMIMMFGIFTVIEAHIVSVYIARNYLLFLMGAYLTTMFSKRSDENGDFIRTQEDYLWKFYTLFGADSQKKHD